MIIVLWILMLLTALAFEYSVLTRTEAKVTLNHREATESYYLAQAGVHKAISELSRPAPPAEPETENREEPTMESLMGPLWVADGRPYRLTLGAGEIEVRVYDEGGKINVNEVNGATLTELLYSLGIEGSISGIVDAILDWRDPDNIYHRNGAEDLYYQSLPQPYHAKNGPFDTIEELLWVKGVTPEIFYGTLPISGLPRKAGLADVFTASLKGTPARSARESEEEPIAFKVNVNTAPVELLMAIPDLGEYHARLIVNERELAPFKNTQDLELIIDDLTAISPFLTFQSSQTYTVNSIGMSTASPINHRIRAIVSVDSKGYKIREWIDSVYARQTS